MNRFQSPSSPSSYTSGPPGLSRMTSVSSGGSSNGYGRANTYTGDFASETTSLHVDNPRSNYLDQLHALAVDAGLPLALPRPMLSTVSHRSSPRGPSDKAGAEEYLMSLRPKKFLVGRSSKGFTSDEIMSGLHKAVEDKLRLPVIEALLQFAESSGVQPNTSALAFTADKKGHNIPTMDYIFGQIDSGKSSDVWRIFLGRVSQRARDDALTRALTSSSKTIEVIQALLDSGANPQSCQHQILDLMMSAQEEDAVEILLLSPLLQDPEFLNLAMTQSVPANSVRNLSMLLFRGADGNWRQGEALKLAITKQRYNLALAVILLSKRAISPSILDQTIGIISSWARDKQTQYLKMLLYAGACGPRTSKTVTPYITEQDSSVTSILLESMAFNHASFPTPILFKAAVEAADLVFALKILRSSRSRSFAEYASTGVHLQLVASYPARPEESFELIAEIFRLGIAGEYASQMLIACCEQGEGESSRILLIDFLIKTGGAKADYSEGKCLLLAIDNRKPAVLKALMVAKPTSKALGAAVKHAGLVLAGDDSAKIAMWSILVQANASGPAVDEELVKAVDKNTLAVSKVKALLPNASLDYLEGEALIRAIQFERLDLLEVCLEQKCPQSSMPSIWKRTRRLFAISAEAPYKLVYMQNVLQKLYLANKTMAPVDELLHDATQSPSKDLAFALSSQFIQWGASPNHTLGAPLIACVRRADTKTLSILLSEKTTQKSLKYALEEATSLQGNNRLEILRLIINAGLDKSSLDALLIRILKEDPYEQAAAHLLVQNGATLHSSWDDYLTRPVLSLDLHLTETLLAKASDKNCALAPLITLLGAQSDWETPSGKALPMVKMLLAQLGRGTWADHQFIAQVKSLNQHAASLFATHLTSKKTLSDALRELLLNDQNDFSPQKLSLVRYLMTPGMVGQYIDEAFLQVIRLLRYEWVTTLNPYLQNQSTRESAFEILAKIQQSGVRSHELLEIRQFLLGTGIRSRAIDEAFIASAVAVNLKELGDLMPSISSTATLSEALDYLTKQIGDAITSDIIDAMRLLLQHGACGTPVLNAARVAGRVQDQAAVNLFLSLCKDTSTRSAIFRGLLESNEPLVTSESRVILRTLITSGLGREDAEAVVRIAVAKEDTVLLEEVVFTGNSARLYGVALATVERTGEQWLTPNGLRFVDFIIRNSRGDNDEVKATTAKMIETASRLQNLEALRQLHAAHSDKERAANIAFVSFMSRDSALGSPNGLAILQFLLAEGAEGATVENAAVHAAETSNIEALNIFLKSPVVGSILPAAFRAVARNKSAHLSSEQLFISTLLVNHGVSTKVLAIAAIEAARLQDFEAIKMLSKSPHFADVTDETLQAIIAQDELWRTPEGLRITQYLFEKGISPKAAEAAASRAATVLDVDALRVIIQANGSGKLMNVAFNSLLGLEKGWLGPDGLRVAGLLINKGISRSSVERAFLQACEHLHHDAALLLQPHVTDPSVFGAGLAKATATGNSWCSELHLIKLLLDAGAAGDVVESGLARGAGALSYSALEILSTKVERQEAYTKALAEAITNEQWRHSLDVIDYLLRHGAQGHPVHEAYISAAGSLDYHASMLLADHVNNPDIHSRAFSAATTTSDWILPVHSDLISLLYNQTDGSSTVQTALVAAAKTLNHPTVELLAKDATVEMASAAFEAAVSGNNDWASEDGTAILRVLASRGATGGAVEKALLESAQQLRLDLVEQLQGNIGDATVDCFSTAFDQLIVSNELWFSDAHALAILQIFINNNAVGELAPQALVVAAQNGYLEALELMSVVVDEPSVYAEAFKAFITSSSLWLQDDSRALLDFMLPRGVFSDDLDGALVSAIEAVILGEASVDLPIQLLNNKADINYDNGKALQLAAQFGRVPLVELLTQLEANPISLYAGLKAAVCSGHEEALVLELFKIIVDSAKEVRPEVNHSSDLGSPLIFYCVQNYPYSVDLARQVCEQGADLGAFIEWSVYEEEPDSPAQESDLISALQFALLQDGTDEVIVDVLLPGNVDVNYVPRHSQASALVLAAKKNSHQVLARLIDLGARVSQKDCFDRTALFYAARNGNSAALTSLLKKRPPPPVNDGSLHEAARELHASAVKMLVQAHHGVDFPSMKHGGRTPLCELALHCRGSTDLEDLHNTLSALKSAKANPLRKYQGRTALFYAIENKNDPVTVVTKMMEVCLWKDLNDPDNVYEHDNYSYSATMYIKKGICRQAEQVALAVLGVLEAASTQDRYYAKERMEQPEDAIGMPQHIAAMDQKRWMRSSRLEQQDEDHRLKLLRVQEEMSHTDQLTSKRHLQVMQHREDLAHQTVDHTLDTHLQSMQLRSLEHNQTMRYKDDMLTYRLDDTIASHHLKHSFDQQSRNAQLEYGTQTNQQKLGYLDKEQILRFDGAQAQQQLRLGGLSAENSLKTERDIEDLQYRAAKVTVDKTDMDNKLKHITDINSDKVFTEDRMQDIARDSQLRKIDLDQRTRQHQIEYQEASDDRRLRTEASMNQYRAENNMQTMRTKATMSQIEIQTLQDKNAAAEADRSSQLNHTRAVDYQKLDTMQRQGTIQNKTLYDKGRIETHTLAEKGRIENTNLQDKHYLLQENRHSELQHTADMGQQRAQNEHVMGRVKFNNESNMGQLRMHNERGMGQVKVANERDMGQQRISNERGMGQVKLGNEAMMGRQKAVNERMIGGEKMRTQAGLNMLNRSKLVDNARAQQASAALKNHQRHQLR